MINCLKLGESRYITGSNSAPGLDWQPAAAGRSEKMRLLLANIDNKPMLIYNMINIFNFPELPSHDNFQWLKFVDNLRSPKNDSYWNETAKSTVSWAQKKVRKIDAHAFLSRIVTSVFRSIKTSYILWKSMTSTFFIFTELANTMKYGGGFLYNLLFTE